MPNDIVSPASTRKPVRETIWSGWTDETPRAAFCIRVAIAFASCAARVVPISNLSASSWAGSGSTYSFTTSVSRSSGMIWRISRTRVVPSPLVVSGPASVRVWVTVMRRLLRW